MQLDLSCIQKARQEYLDNNRVIGELAVMCVEYITDEVRKGSQYVSLKHTSVVRLYNKLIRTSNSSADAIELSDNTYDAVKDILVENFAKNGYKIAYLSDAKTLVFSGWR
jgi:hypothetical protein